MHNVFALYLRPRGYNFVIDYMFSLKRWFIRLVNKDVVNAKPIEVKHMDMELEVLTDRALTLYERVVPLRERMCGPITRALVLEYLTNKYGDLNAT